MALIWSLATSPTDAYVWQTVIWAESYGRFIAHNLGDGSGTDYINTSPDGETWTSYDLPNSTIYDALGYDDTLNLTVMVGQVTDAYAYSTDGGHTWSVASAPSLYATDQRTVVGSNGTTIIALGYSNDGARDLIYTTNGTAWSNGTCQAGVWRDVCWSPTLGLFVAVGEAGGTNSIMTSPDGTTWTARTPPAGGYDWDSIVWAAALGKFIAISHSGRRAMTSTNGTSWTATGDLGWSTDHGAIVWGDNLSTAIVINLSAADPYTVQTSLDGTTWTEVDISDVVTSSFSTPTLPKGAYAPGLQTFIWPSQNSEADFLLASPGTGVAGWYKNDIPGLESGVDATIVSGADARPKGPRGNVFTSPFNESNPLFGFPGHAVAFNNRMVYAAGDYTVGTDLPPIRVWNGTSDYQLCQVPKDGSGNTPKCITTIANGDGSVYLGTWDTGTTSSNVIGRILKLDPNSGQLTNVGNVNALTGYIPWALKFHNGELWAGMHRSDTSAGRIYRIKPEEQTTWTQDRDLSSDSVGPCTVIEAYNGKMYFGTAAAAGTFAKFGVRDTSGAYSLIETASSGTARAYNGYYAATVFADDLYFSYWNPDTTEVSLIKKYDGTSVTTAYTVTAVADVPIISLFVHDGVLYALGVRRSGGAYTSVVLTTPDGTTWTNRTGDLPTTGFTSTGVTNAFASIAY